jgi:hypothetical protein
MGIILRVPPPPVRPELGHDRKLADHDSNDNNSSSGGYSPVACCFPD